MSILLVNKLALDLVARDFSDGHAPTNGGPTKTSRALAIIHLAARDAYAAIVLPTPYAPKLSPLPAVPGGLARTTANGETAALSAGVRAAELLYPDDSAYISQQSSGFLAIGNAMATQFGYQVAVAWVASRQADGASLPQLDSLYDPGVGRHRPDPLAPAQPTLGRNWGKVKPFVLLDVETDAKLKPPHLLNSKEYADDFKEVYECGRNNIPNLKSDFRKKAAEGIFWGYDGSNKLGTPPRLYNQVITSTAEFMALTEEKRINVLAAINAAMADAGIAAWYWKYTYDRWRPVVGIREAGSGWGPTGAGDGNPKPNEHDPFWLPLGAPASNETNKQNGTPNFPAYPSGHATFGSACFKAFAQLVGVAPKDIKFNFVSDEFNGTTTDNRGAVRPRFEYKNMSLLTAIKDNDESRIFLGVHWRDDAEGGNTVGTAIAAKAFDAFK